MVAAVLQQLRTFFLPSICAHCRAYLKTRAVFCSACADLITPVAPKLVDIPARYTIAVHALSAYEAPLRSLIVAKNQGDYTAGYQLGQLMAERLMQEIRGDYFVPVPLHWTRALWRGFNQSETIAQVMAKERGARMLPVVRRVRRTYFQAELAAPARMQNVKHAFTLGGEYECLRDAHVVVVDDLMTTGSTLVEVARVVAQAKPARISAVVACRVV